jgi:hypothetical protein
MSKKKENNDTLLPEYDFSKAVRGKYTKRFEKSSNIVVIAPDVMKSFPDSDSVNETLRAVAKIAKRTRKKIAA